MERPDEPEEDEGGEDKQQPTKQQDAVLAVGEGLGAEEAAPRHEAGQGDPQAGMHKPFASAKVDRVLRDGEPVRLTPTEYDILRLLLQRPGEVLSPEEIYRQVWQEAPTPGDGTVAVHIRHLREKIEIDPSDPRYIKVVWGQGYKLETGGVRDDGNQND